MRDEIVVRCIIGYILGHLFWSVNSSALVSRPLSVHDMEQWEEQQPVPENELAGFQQRLFNFLADAILFAAFRFLCYDLTPKALYHWTFLVPLTIVAWLLYYPYMEFRTGKTLAKFISRTKAVDFDGTEMDGRQAMQRNLLRLIPLEVFSFIGKFPVGWHDRFSGTRVMTDYFLPAAPQWEEEK